VSGSGNVAQYAAEKLIQLGAVVLTLSDSTGYIYEKDGFTQEQVQQVRHGFRCCDNIGGPMFTSWYASCGCLCTVSFCLDAAAGRSARASMLLFSQLAVCCFLLVCDCLLRR
jgi:hypothetical protein